MVSHNLFDANANGEETMLRSDNTYEDGLLRGGSKICHRTTYAVKRSNREPLFYCVESEKQNGRRKHFNGNCESHTDVNMSKKRRDSLNPLKLYKKSENTLYVRSKSRAPFNNKMEKGKYKLHSHIWNIPSRHVSGLLELALKWRRRCFCGYSKRIISSNRKICLIQFFMPMSKCCKKKLNKIGNLFLTRNKLQTCNQVISNMTAHRRRVPPRFRVTREESCEKINEGEVCLYVCHCTVLKNYNLHVIWGRKKNKKGIMDDFHDLKSSCKSSHSKHLVLYHYNSVENLKKEKNTHVIPFAQFSYTSHMLGLVFAQPTHHCHQLRVKNGEKKTCNVFSVNLMASRSEVLSPIHCGPCNMCKYEGTYSQGSVCNITEMNFLIDPKWRKFNMYIIPAKSYSFSDLSELIGAVIPEHIPLNCNVGMGETALFSSLQHQGEKLFFYVPSYTHMKIQPQRFVNLSLLNNPVMLDKNYPQWIEHPNCYLCPPSPLGRKKKKNDKHSRKKNSSCCVTLPNLCTPHLAHLEYNNYKCTLGKGEIILQPLLRVKGEADVIGLITHGKAEVVYYPQRRVNAPANGKLSPVRVIGGSEICFFNEEGIISGTPYACMCAGPYPSLTSTPWGRMPGGDQTEATSPYFDKFVCTSKSREQSREQSRKLEHIIYTFMHAVERIICLAAYYLSFLHVLHYNVYFYLTVLVKFVECKMYMLIRRENKKGDHLFLLGEEVALVDQMEEEDHFENGKVTSKRMVVLPYCDKSLGRDNTTKRRGKEYPLVAKLLPKGHNKNGRTIVCTNSMHTETVKECVARMGKSLTSAFVPKRATPCADRRHFSSEHRLTRPCKNKNKDEKKEMCSSMSRGTNLQEKRNEAYTYEPSEEYSTLGNSPNYEQLVNTSDKNHLCSFSYTPCKSTLFLSSSSNKRCFRRKGTEGNRGRRKGGDKKTNDPKGNQEKGRKNRGYGNESDSHMESDSESSSGEEEDEEDDEEEEEEEDDDEDEEDDEVEEGEEHDGEEEEGGEFDVEDENEQEEEHDDDNEDVEDNDGAEDDDEEEDYEEDEFDVDEENCDDEDEDVEEEEEQDDDADDEENDEEGDDDDEEDDEEDEDDEPEDETDEEEQDDEPDEEEEDEYEEPDGETDDEDETDDDDEDQAYHKDSSKKRKKKGKMRKEHQLKDEEESEGEINTEDEKHDYHYNHSNSHYDKKKKLYLKKKNKRFKHRYVYLNNVFKDSVCINTTNVSNFITVSKDKLTATYSAWGKHTDIACVQVNKCASRDCSIYYFEVEVLSCSNFSKIVIGMTSKNYTINKNPGSEYNSFGYKNDDGKKIIDSKLESYSNGYTKYDIIGCGINYFDNSAFFTKNGKFLGKACNVNPKYDYYATVGLTTLGDRIKFHLNNFYFDIYNMIYEECEKERKIIKSIYIQKDIFTDVIKSHLIKCGYFNTYKSFVDFVEKHKNTADNGSSVGGSSNTKQSLDKFFAGQGDETKKDEIKKNEIKKDEVKKDEVKKDEAKKDQVKKDTAKDKPTCDPPQSADYTPSTSLQSSQTKYEDPPTHLSQTQSNENKHDDGEAEKRKGEAAEAANDQIQKADESLSKTCTRTSEAPKDASPQKMERKNSTEDQNDEKDKHDFNKFLINYLDAYEKLNKEERGQSKDKTEETKQGGETGNMTLTPSSALRSDQNEGEDKQAEDPKSATDDTKEDNRPVADVTGSSNREEKASGTDEQKVEASTGGVVTPLIDAATPAVEPSISRGQILPLSQAHAKEDPTEEAEKQTISDITANILKSYEFSQYNYPPANLQNTLWISRKNTLGSLLNIRKDSNTLLLNRLKGKRSLNLKEDLNILATNFFNSKKEARKSESDINKKIQLLLREKSGMIKNESLKKLNKKEGKGYSVDKEYITKYFVDLYLSDDKLKKMVHSLQTRHIIRNSIISGNIIQVLNILEEEYADLLTNEKGSFHIAMLYTQQLIEILKPNKKFIKKISLRKKKCKKLGSYDIEDDLLSETSYKTYDTLSDDHFYDDIKTDCGSSDSLLCESSNEEYNRHKDIVLKLEKLNRRGGNLESVKRKETLGSCHKQRRKKLVEHRARGSDKSCDSNGDSTDDKGDSSVNSGDNMVKGCSEKGQATGSSSNGKGQPFDPSNAKKEEASKEDEELTRNAGDDRNADLANHPKTQEGKGIDTTEMNETSKRNSQLNDNDLVKEKKIERMIYRSMRSNYDEEFFETNNLQEEYEQHYNKLSKEYEFFEEDNPYNNKNRKQYFRKETFGKKRYPKKAHTFSSSGDDDNSTSDGDSNDSNFNEEKHYEFNDINFDEIYQYIYKNKSPNSEDVKFKKDHLYLALLWIREKLSHFNKSRQVNVRQCILDTTSLIAYHKPYKERLVRMFFSKNRNLLTFSSVNEGILGLCLKVPVYSPLEIMVKHLILCRNLLREKKGNIGIKYDCRYVCQPYKRYMIKVKNNKKKRRYFKEATKQKNEKGSLNGKIIEDNRLSIF
ncbi:hypothetical protein AK88_04122 [Plasmodium fragile]|uniref:B30.2/SPRY domain-containing protein n=1 Tax=Plasmodium fragile TaxID=5857 RepID=A0A0D9QGZ3_PLAFR|nr:uncharacterized protein AK88_04122 [Plasmodium fragile]KJP86228.1 hypothetical protein AK88_04122 [Plasmodium fragile]